MKTTRRILAASLAGLLCIPPAPAYGRPDPGTLRPSIENETPQGVATGLEEQTPEGPKKRNRPSQQELTARRARIQKRLNQKPPQGERWTIQAIAQAEGLERQTVYRDLNALGLLTLERLELQEREEYDRSSQEELTARRARIQQRLNQKPPQGERWTIQAIAQAEGLEWKPVYNDLNALGLLTSERLEVEDYDRPSQQELTARRARIQQRLNQKPPQGERWTIPAIAQAEGLERQTVYDDLNALGLLDSERLELRSRKPPATGLEEGMTPEFLRYAQRIAKRINQEDLFTIELDRRGLIRKLVSSPEETLYDAEEPLTQGLEVTPPILHGQVMPLAPLAYTADSGLLAVGPNLEMFWHFLPDGRSIFLEPEVGKKEWNTQQIPKLMRKLVSEDGAASIDFPRRPQEDAEDTSSLESVIQIVLAKSRMTARIIEGKNGWIVSYISHPAAGAEEVNLQITSREVERFKSLASKAGAKLRVDFLDPERTASSLNVWSAAALRGKKGRSFDDGSVNVTFLKDVKRPGAAGQWIVTLEPDVWDFERAEQAFFSRGVSKWSGTVHLISGGKEGRKILGEHGQPVAVGAQRDAAGRLYLSAYGQSDDSLADSAPRLLMVAASMMREGSAGAADLARVIPLRLQWFSSAGDLAYDRLKQDLYVASDGNIYNFGVESGIYRNMWKGVYQSDSSVRLQHDPAGQALYLMRIRNGRSEILRLPTATDGVPRKVILSEKSSRNPLGFVDFTLIPSRDEIAVLTGETIRLFDAKSGAPAPGADFELERPAAFAYDPKQERFFVAVRQRNAEFEYRIAVYDFRTGRRLERWEDISFPGTPWTMTFDPISRKLFLAGSLGAREVDVDKRSYQDLLPGTVLSMPRRVVYAPETQSLFVLEKMSVHQLGTLGRVRIFSAETAQAAPVPAVKPESNPLVLHQPHGVFVGPFHRAAQAVLVDLLEKREVREIVIPGPRKIDFRVEPIDTVIETAVGLGRLRKDLPGPKVFRFRREGPRLEVDFPPASGPGKPAAGAEEREKMRVKSILNYRFDPADSVQEARDSYMRFEMWKLIPWMERTVGATVTERLFQDSVPTRFEIGLKEAAYNLMEHGRGGVLEVQRFHKGLVFRFQDQGEGVSDPEQLLRESAVVHDKPGASRGYGFMNLALSGGWIILESRGKKWKLNKKGPDDFHFMPSGRSAVVKGTVLAVAFEDLWAPSLTAGAEETSGLRAWFSKNYLSPQRVRPQAQERLSGVIALRDNGDRRGAWSQLRLIQDRMDLNVWEEYAAGLLRAAWLIIETEEQDPRRPPKELLDEAIETLEHFRAHPLHRWPDLINDRRVFHSSLATAYAARYWIADDPGDGFRALKEFDTALSQAGPDELARNRDLYDLKQRVEQKMRLGFAAGLEELMDAARGPVREIAGPITVLVDPAVAPGATGADLKAIARRLRRLSGYPMIEILPLSAGTLGQPAAAGARVMQLKLFGKTATADPDTVYVQAAAGSEEGIPTQALPLLVTDALARWRRARGRILTAPIILPAAPYLNAAGMEDGDFADPILSERFA